LYIHDEKHSILKQKTASLLKQNKNDMLLANPHLKLSPYMPWGHAGGVDVQLYYGAKLR
jgi:hypothetical protein